MEWLWLVFSSLVTFVLLLILVRWIGSTQLTQLTLFNWVAGASMGNIAANMMSATKMHDYLYISGSLILFTALAVFFSYLALKFRWFRTLTNGEPFVLIYKGMLLRRNMRKTKVNLDVLMMLLREKGYFAFTDIRYAIMEPTGNLSVLPIHGVQTVTKEDVESKSHSADSEHGPFVDLVVDGEVIQKNLVRMGYSESWLTAQLTKLGDDVSLSDVLYFAINEKGEIIVDLHRRLRLFGKSKNVVDAL